MTELDAHSPHDTGPVPPVPPVPPPGLIALTRRTQVRQLLRFGVVGALGTVVNLVVVHLLYNELGWGYTRSSAIATEVAFLHNYVLNELWTFHVRKLSLRRLVQYHMSSLLGFGVTVTVATLAKEVIDPLLAQLVGILCGAGLNYMINARWTWGSRASSKKTNVAEQ